MEQCHGALNRSGQFFLIQLAEKYATYVQYRVINVMKNDLLLFNYEKNNLCHYFKLGLLLCCWTIRGQYFARYEGACFGRVGAAILAHWK